MKKRKTLLSVAHEFLAALPRLFKHRPVQLMFTGIGVIAVSLPILDYYHVSPWMMLIPAFIGLAFFFLGFIDWGTVEEEEKSEYEEIMQKLEFVEKELKEIRNKLEKIEGGL